MTVRGARGEVQHALAMFARAAKLDMAKLQAALAWLGRKELLDSRYLFEVRIELQTLLVKVSGYISTILTSNIWYHMLYRQCFSFCDPTRTTCYTTGIGSPAALQRMEQRWAEGPSIHVTPTDNLRPEKETRQEKQLRKLGIESDSAHAHRWPIYHPSNMHKKFYWGICEFHNVTSQGLV